MGVRALKRRLLPLAKVVTLLPEAEALSGMFIKSSEDMRQAARAIHEMYGCAGDHWGHLRGKEIWSCTMAAMNTSLLLHDCVAVLGVVRDVGLLLRWLRSWLRAILCRPLSVRPRNG